jgi:hypothetical protein
MRSRHLNWRGQVTRMESPYFILSLDTEFLWGPTDESYKALLHRNAKDVRKAISLLLDLLRKYDIPATWAVVGHLFLDACDETSCLTWRNIMNHGYHRDWYQDPYSDIRRDPLYYGKDVIEKIVSDTERHEIGYHSFSHPRFSEISREFAEGEIREAKKIEKAWGIHFSSFVFPRNEVAHLEVLKEYGFTIFRGAPAVPRPIFHGNLGKTWNRSIAKIIAPPVMPAWRDGLWEIPSSMCFCDPQVPFSVLPKARLGLKRAMDNRMVFHAYLHPWNLVLYAGLYRDLEKFLAYVSSMQKRGWIECIPMGTYAELLSSQGVASTHAAGENAFEGENVTPSKREMY